MHVQATSRSGGQLMREQGRHAEYELVSGPPDATNFKALTLQQAAVSSQGLSHV